MLPSLNTPIWKLPGNSIPLSHSTLPANSLLVAVSVAAIQVICCSFFCLWCDVHEDQGQGYAVPAGSFYLYGADCRDLYSCYIILSRLGLLDSYQGLILSNGVSVLGIFLLRQAFEAVPMEPWRRPGWTAQVILEFSQGLYSP